MAKKKPKSDRELITEAVLKATRQRLDSQTPGELLQTLSDEERFEFGAGRPGGESLPVAKPKWDDPRRSRRPRGPQDFETGHQYGAPFHEEAMKYGGPEYAQEFVGPPDPIPPDYRSGYQYGSKRGKPLSEAIRRIMMEAAGKEARHGPYREGMPGYEYPEEVPYTDEGFMGGGPPGMTREEYYEDPRNQQKLWEEIQQGLGYEGTMRRRREQKYRGEQISDVPGRYGPGGEYGPPAEREPPEKEKLYAPKVKSRSKK